MLKRFSLLASLAFCATLVQAQAVITGTVVDDLGDPAFGANIAVVGSDPFIGTTTDLDGKYRIEVPAIPNTTLKFSYVGLGEKTVTDITVTNGEVTFLDIAFEEESLELETVTVTAKALQNTDVAIVKIRAGSDKILDGISSQEMSRLALSDAAGALTKVTGTTIVDGKFIVVRGLGDRYSTAQLNGLEMPSTDPYRNSPQLDLIPANLLDNIITSKTFTPDQPGSFTGGNVNLQTKDFPEQQTFSVSVSAGYNTLATGNDNFLRHRGGENDYWGYDDGTRELPQRLVDIGDLSVDAGRGSPGTVSILTPDVNRLLIADEANATAFELVEEASDILATDYALQSQAPEVNHSFSLSYGNQHDLGKNRKLGYVLNGSFGRDYQHYDNGVAAIYSLTDANAENLNTSFNFTDRASTETPTVSGFGSLSFQFAPGQTVRALGVYNHNTEILSRELIGEAPELNIADPDILENRAIRFLERETQTFQLSGDHALDKTGSLKLNWAGGYTISAQDEPNLRLFAATRRLLNGDIAYNIQSGSYSRPLNFFRSLEDQQYEGLFDLEKEFAGGHKIKIGASHREKTRAFTERIYEIQTNERNEIADYNGNPDEYFFDENMGFLDSTALSTPTRTRQGIANWVVDNTAPANSYDGTESISAAYAMATLKLFPKFRTVLGARLERTDIEVVSRDQTLPDSVGTAVVLGTDLLPSVNLIYSPNESSNIRATFSQTLARPNMREIALFPSFDFIGGPVFSGNPNIRRTNVDNYDLRYEYFLERGGILSASAFYKKFRDPIVSTFLQAAALEFTYINVDEATVYGLELEAKRNLNFITPALEKLTVGANFSLIHSEVPIPPLEVERNGLEVDTRQFQGQSPYIANVNASYVDRDADFDVTLAFNYFGDRLAFNGAEGTPDVFERGRGSLDLSTSKAFGPLTVRLVAQNLLDPKYQTYATFKGKDFIFGEYRRGQTFKVSLGYTFKS